MVAIEQSEPNTQTKCHEAKLSQYYSTAWKARRRGKNLLFTTFSKVQLENLAV